MKLKYTITADLEDFGIDPDASLDEVLGAVLRWYQEFGPAYSCQETDPQTAVLYALREYGLGKVEEVEEGDR